MENLLTCASDTILSVSRLISTTQRYIFTCAKKLDCGKNCSQRLEDALGPLQEVLELLDSKKMSMLHSYGLTWYEPNMDVLYGNPVSGTLSTANRNRVSKVIKSLQQVGRYGTAYFVKLHHLHHFPRQFETEDRLLLEDVASDLLALLKRYDDSSWRKYGVLEPFWAAFIRSPILPHECQLVAYTANNKSLTNEALTQSAFASSESRRDCLGRSISHLYNDYRGETEWREADLHHEDILGRTALYYACREGNHTLVKDLIKAGVDMYKPVVTGMGPLHFAARGGHTPVCESLWNSGVKDNFPNGVRNSHGSAPPTPVVCAADAGMSDTVEYFCKNVLKPADRKQLSFLLISAVQKRSIGVVDVLLDFKEYYNIQEKDRYGHNALWYAEHWKSTPPEIETALKRAIGVVSSSPTASTNQNPLPDLDAWYLPLYVDAYKKTQPKTLRTLSLNIDEAFLSHLLKVEGFSQTLGDEDLILVRTIATGTKNEQHLHGINQAIADRLREVPDFVGLIPSQHLTLVKNISQVNRDEYARDVIRRAVEDPRRKRQHVQVDSATTLDQRRKRHRPNENSDTIQKSSSQLEYTGLLSPSTLPNE